MYKVCHSVRHACTPLSWLLSYSCADSLCLAAAAANVSQVRGKNPPRPIRTWTQSGISSKVLEILRKQGFERPLSIQAQVGGQLQRLQGRASAVCQLHICSLAQLAVDAPLPLTMPASLACFWIGLLACDACTPTRPTADIMAEQCAFHDSRCCPSLCCFASLLTQLVSCVVTL